MSIVAYGRHADDFDNNSFWLIDHYTIELLNTIPELKLNSMS
jgi:hypothetical protein